MNKKLLVLFIIFSSLVQSQTFTNELEIPSLLTGPNFELSIKESQKEFTSGVSTDTYSYNEMNYLGPTLLFQKDETVSFNITNNVTEDVTVHWHGFHIPAKWDGGPGNLITPGTTWSPEFLVMEHASTMWYHSHVHANTARQVAKGMAGLIIIQDEEEAALELPRTYGVDDFPLIIQDKLFNNNGQIQPNPLGDVMMVNGTLSPYLEAPAQVVRFRMLNASIERTFYIGFNDDRTFYQIGTDGGLLEAPVSLNRLRIAPGERAEVLVDLTGETVGNTLQLLSYSSELPEGVAGACTDDGPGCGDGPLDGTDFQFMELRIVSQTDEPVSTIPNGLVDIDFISTLQIDETRVKTLMNPANPGDPFTIDGNLFDMNVINDTVYLGNTEIWRFVNESQLAHPMHIHDVQFNILSRNGEVPPANETGWKDVVLVFPDETVEVVAKFDDYADSVYTYMMHCHLLGHEDNGMMEQFLVVDPAWYITSVAENSSESNLQTSSFYPNPVRGLMNLKLGSQQSGKTEVTIYNILGEVITKKTIDRFSNPQLNLNNLTSGRYFMSLNTNGKVQVMKFIKR